MKSTDQLLAQQFGKNVRRLRRTHGYSQQQLAELCSMHRTAISFIEQGQRLPRLDTLIKLIAVLGPPVDELLIGVPIWVPGLSEDGEWVAGFQRS